MKKYKICVYAISCNEEKFVNRWVQSMKEADEIYVLDTGSVDNTVALLKENGIHVSCKKIEPWRFDVARNFSLELVPEDTDICVCTDLDEVFLPGWRKELEKIWQDGVKRVAYNYNWSLNEQKQPIINFYIEKIHARKNYTWTHPVHEVLSYLGNDEEKKITTDQITLNHFPDPKKSRKSYLPLLELSVKEDPEDDRNMHYLGREYMYYGKYQEAIDILSKHLTLKKAIWKDERCASMRFIARCYQKLGKKKKAKKWLDKAMIEAPYLREPFMERAFLAYQLEEWEDVIYYIMKALKIKYHTKSYINEPFSWNETPYDLLSIAFYSLEEYDFALVACQKALKINPTNIRIKNNLKLIEQVIPK